MKKKFLYALCCSLVLGVSACSNDDPQPQPKPQPEPEPISLGFFVLNQGNLSKAVEGSLTSYGYDTETAVQNVFQTVNGRSIGNTPQTAIIYGSHIYIGVYESNTIEIINRWNAKEQKQISLENAEGQSPRSMVAKDGKVYISMYNGHVSRLDTLTLEIDKTVQVGPNPEIMAIKDNYLYVPNSDGMNWREGYGTTASKIDLSTFTATTFNVGLNPTHFISNGDDLFLLCKGNYGDVASKVYKVGDDDSITELAEATLLAINNDYLYYINAPYGAPSITYKKYDLKTNTSSDLLADSGVDSPVWIAVDPVTGTLVITSYSMDNGYASYSTDGYAKIYDKNGQFLQQIEVGVGPAWVFFDEYNLD